MKTKDALIALIEPHAFMLNDNETSSFSYLADLIEVAYPNTLHSYTVEALRRYSGNIVKTNGEISIDISDEIVTWEIELDKPDGFVTFEAPRNTPDHKLLDLAIRELTRNTSIWTKKIVEKD